MSQRPHPDPGERPVPSKAAPESAMAAGEGEDAFLEAASRPGVATLAEPAAVVEEPIEVYEVTDPEADPQATLVVEGPEALLVRPAPAPVRPRLALVPGRPPP